MVVFAVALTIIEYDKMYYLPILLLGLFLFGFKLFSVAKEKKNSSIDSKILIKELEKRVYAVNHWER